MSLKERMYHTARLCLIRSGPQRAEYLRKKQIFNHIGENVLMMPRKIPLYPKLIRIHDNVHIASNVSFITHDGIHTMLNQKHKANRFKEKIGCIEIMKNVFIGSNSIIMYDIKIGANSIVAAGSIVTKDVPENSIVAGIPAKVIGKLSDYEESLLNEDQLYSEELKPKGQHISKRLVNIMWENFEKNRICN